MSYVLQYQEQYQNWMAAKVDVKMIGKLNNANANNNWMKFRDFRIIKS